MDRQHRNLINILALGTRGVDSVDRFRGPPAFICLTREVMGETCRVRFAVALGLG